MKLRDDQLIRAIRLPRRRHELQRFVKVGPRRQQAIAKVGLVLARSAEGWRVVTSSVAPTVCRCPALEELSEGGRDFSSADDLLPAIRKDVAPIDDMRSTALYRERVLSRVLFHALKDDP